ncbi:hypothetical protein QYF36_025795 [Acer negundo]|nr:hypothetical protein QYF36_025795 [Acer negundo]
MSPGNIDLYAKDTLVEVSCADGWFPGRWFVAKVLDPPSPSPTAPGKMTLLVEYQSLLYGTKLLRRRVDIKFVRPLPPPPPNDEQEQQRFEVNDAVDAYLDNGWWVGVVSKVLGEEEQRVYSVLLGNPSRTVDFRSSDLRFHLDWVGDKWIQPRKQNKMSSEVGEKRGTLMEAETSSEKRKRGKHVKFLFKGKKCGGAEGDVDKIDAEDSSTTEAAAVDNMPYENQNLRSLESSPVLKFVQSLKEFQLMPQKPHFRPLDECEVVFREGLALKHIMTFVNVVKETSKLQVNASGSIMDSLLKCLPELESHGFDIKDLIDAIEEIKVLEEKKARLISMNEENDSEIAKLKSSDSSLNEHIQNVEHNFNKMSSEVGEKRGKQMEAETNSEKRKRVTHMKFLFKGKGCRGAEGGVDKIDVEGSSTTDECEVVFREGLALKYMMTFVNVVKEISKLQVNAPGSIMDSILKSLPELESHGFNVKDVRNRLLDLQTIKRSQEHLQTKLAKVKCEIKMRTYEGTEINAELIDAIEKIKLLEEKKARLISLNEENNSETAKLKSSDSSLNEHIQNVERNFAILATFPRR